MLFKKEFPWDCESRERGSKPASVPKTTLQENFAGKIHGAPKSPGGVGEEEGKVVSGGGWVLVFFLPLFYSKVFLHMTQTSLNFPKLQSLLMAWPQSGRENVKSGGKKKKTKQNSL